MLKKMNILRPGTSLFFVSKPSVIKLFLISLKTLDQLTERYSRMKFNFLIILLTSLAFIMFSCDDSGNPSAGTNFDPSGTWNGEFKNSDSATVSVIYELDSDNTYWMHMKLDGDVRYREEGDWIFNDSDTLQVTPTLTIIWNEMLQQLEKTYFNTPPYMMAEEDGSFRYSSVIDSVLYSTLLVK